VYEGKHGTIAGLTKSMYRIRLKSGMSIRIMKNNVGYYHQNTVIWQQQVYEDLQNVRKYTEIVAILLSKSKFIMVKPKSSGNEKHLWTT
jgi:hypothetical protein